MVDCIVSPPPELMDCVREAFLKTLPGGRYCLPASLQPLFLLILRGGITVHHAAGEQALPAFCLSGGMRNVCRASALPGTRILTLSLLPGALRRLLDLSPQAVMDEVIEVRSLLPAGWRPALDHCLESIAQAPDEKQQAAQLFDLVAAWRSVRGHLAADLVVPSGVLALPARTLAEQFGVGVRQFERRFLTSYGQSLKSYRRQVRCARLLGQVLAEQLFHNRHDVGLADLAVRTGYYDQAHLCRDFLAFTGHTPSALLAGVAEDDPAFWPYRLDREKLFRLFGPDGY